MLQCLAMQVDDQTDHVTVMNFYFFWLVQTRLLVCAQKWKQLVIVFSSITRNYKKLQENQDGCEYTWDREQHRLSSRYGCRTMAVNPHITWTWKSVDQWVRSGLRHVSYVGDCRWIKESKLQLLCGFLPARSLDKLYNFADCAGLHLILGLNALHRNPDNSWNTSSTLSLLKYSAGKKYNISWELGNGQYSNTCINPHTLSPK